MTTKNPDKGVSDIDLNARRILSEAVGYKVVLFRPQSSVRDSFTVTSLPLAIENASKVVNDYRCAMIYAFDKGEQYVMVGHVMKNGQYVGNKFR